MRSPADPIPEGATTNGQQLDDSGSRGGITRSMVQELMAICLVVDEKVLARFLGQVRATSQHDHFTRHATQTLLTPLTRV